MYIYCGEISFNPSTPRENLVVILPDEIKIGADALVICKWPINTNNEISKQEKNAVGIISGVEKTDSGIAIRIQYNQDYYSDVVMAEDEQSIKITMHSKGHNNSLKSTLYMTHKNNTKIPTNLPFSSIAVNSSVASTIDYCKVINDTDTVYFCTLIDSADDEKRKETVLGIMGLVYSFVGLVTSKAPTPVGVVIGVHSILYGAFTMAWDSLFPKPPVSSRAVLPGHSITRKLPYLFVPTTYDLILTRMRIKQEKDGNYILLVETATKKNLENQIYLITNIEKEKEKEKEWQPVLRLVMTSSHKIVSRVSVTIDKFIVNSSDYTPTNVNSNIIHHKFGTWFCYQEKVQDGKISEEEKDALKFDFNNWKKEVNLKYSEKYKSSFIDMPSKEILESNNTDSAVVEIINPDDPNLEPRLVLRLKGYHITPIPKRNGKSLKSAGGQIDVLDIIGSNPSYHAYLWDGRGNSVIGYEGQMTINKIDDNNSYVYLWIQKITPYLVLQSNS
ncbi:hypothetical protein L7750_18095 [Xenorhabdus bovienii]|uniref:hypothetical protein n=1 Tax=Xenorhabdus bovienii TaxID=40576 RepID=UPI001EDE1856|nr:hypothetical protein [Xenorhabdus bovienii]MCG3472220.1 hypothetical protein [Xenorhabdus bovienii]